MADLACVAACRSYNPVMWTEVCDEGNTFVNTERESLLIKYTANPRDDPAITVTIETHKLIDGESVGDKTIDINPGETHLVGPFPGDIYNDTEGRVTVKCDVVCEDVEIAVIKIP